MMKFIRWCILFGIVFGAGYYTGQQPDAVKRTLRDLSGEVLESTIGLDKTVKLQQQMLEAKDGLIEGRAYLLEHDFREASGEFERALQHLDEAVALDPNGALAEKIQSVKEKILAAQTSLAQGRELPPYLLEELRQELQTVMP